MTNLATIQALILDMDGVLWRSTEAIGDLPSIFDKISKAGLKVTFATNNATRDEDQYLEKLNDFGIQAEKDQIVNSSMAALNHLQKLFPEGGPIYLIGESGLANILSRGGFYHDEENPLAVVVGMDRLLTYEKLSKAAILINHGTPFIGTNPDVSFPTPLGETVGTGAILASLEAATKTAPVICGKPFSDMMDIAIERMGSLRHHTLVVGDRYETDIIGGVNANCPTALVLSGVTSLEALSSFDPQPDFVFQDLNALVEEMIRCKHQ